MKHRAPEIEARALETLRGNHSLDLVVAGHAHLPAVVEAGRYYLNAGDWIYALYISRGAGGRSAGNEVVDGQNITVKPWVSQAREAGVAELAAFETCISLPADSFPRIAAELNEAERTGAAGTPTFWVNQWYVPNGLSLGGRIEALLAGKKP